ncbi:MAG: DUF4040 domain-containing protein [Candidatus Cloacimonadaceae bacterium]|nr:DUF4040 domain-containing protein [Candidatus Cloacimonadaceae bacterium]MDP3114348.1 DUF4040 domain-containing protein [Candidatus Cloacimonadaceae bacterium]
MFENAALVVLGFISVLAAIFAVLTKRVVSAVIASGVISLMASIMFLIASAPDVAMTEATIGAGLTTVIFLYALKHIRASRGGKND